MNINGKCGDSIEDEIIFACETGYSFSCRHSGDSASPNTGFNVGGSMLEFDLFKEIVSFVERKPGRKSSDFQHYNK